MVAPPQAQEQRLAHALFEPTDQQDTEEAAVGGVREVERRMNRIESEERDWALDDDAADYSAAV